MNFWFEASATGMEEVGAPEVNDYVRYIPEFLDQTGTPIDQNTAIYGASLFFLYLHNRVDSLFDKSIWENFSKNPEGSFRQQYASAVEARKKNPQDVFQDFAERLAYSGKNSKASSSATYSVRSGDTLGKIAKTHGTTVKKLCKLNGISQNTPLRVGQKLKVK